MLKSGNRSALVFSLEIQFFSFDLRCFVFCFFKRGPCFTKVISVFVFLSLFTFFSVTAGKQMGHIRTQSVFFKAWIPEAYFPTAIKPWCNLCDMYVILQFIEGPKAKNTEEIRTK